MSSSSGDYSQRTRNYAACSFLPMIPVNPNTLANQLHVLRRLDNLTFRDQNRLWAFVTADAGATPLSAVVGKRTQTYDYSRWMYVAALGHEDQIFLEAIWNLVNECFELNFAIDLLQLPRDGRMPSTHNRRDFVFFLGSAMATFVARSPTCTRLDGITALCKWFLCNVVTPYKLYVSGMRKCNYEIFIAGRVRLLPLLFICGRWQYQRISMLDMANMEWRSPEAIRAHRRRHFTVLNNRGEGGEGHDYKLEARAREYKRLLTSATESSHVAAEILVAHTPEMLACFRRLTGIAEREQTQRADAEMAPLVRKFVNVALLNGFPVKKLIGIDLLDSYKYKMKVWSERLFTYLESTHDDRQEVSFNGKIQSVEKLV